VRLPNRSQCQFRRVLPRGVFTPFFDVFPLHVQRYSPLKVLFFFPQVMFVNAKEANSSLLPFIRMTLQPFDPLFLPLGFQLCTPPAFVCKFGFLLPLQESLIPGDPVCWALTCGGVEESYFWFPHMVSLLGGHLTRLEWTWFQKMKLSTLSQYGLPMSPFFFGTTFENGVVTRGDALKYVSCECIPFFQSTLLSSVVSLLLFTFFFLCPVEHVSN